MAWVIPPQLVIFLKTDAGRHTAQSDGWRTHIHHRVAIVAQLVARRSDNPKVTSAILTCHTAAQAHDEWSSSFVENMSKSSRPAFLSTLGEGERAAWALPVTWLSGKSVAERSKAVAQGATL